MTVYWKYLGTLKTADAPCQRFFFNWIQVWLRSKYIFKNYPSESHIKSGQRTTRPSQCGLAGLSPPETPTILIQNEEDRYPPNTY